MTEYDLQDDLNIKLKHYFDGKIVRKDLTKRVKEALTRIAHTKCEVLPCIGANNPYNYRNKIYQK